MKIEKKTVTKINLSDIDGLDPISVIAEDLGPGQGQIVITCYGQSWSAYWGGMGDRTICEFFCSCDEHYLAGKLSNIGSQVYDLEAFQSQAKEKGISCCRDDPWNDYEFMTQMYGSDMYDWHLHVPMKTNPDYSYLCRIIKAVQDGLGTDS